MERFWKKVAKGSDQDCWEWTATRNARGYGRIRMGSPSRLAVAHRVAYELVVGPIPAGLELDHTCCNPGCVNPAHLEPVTHLENLRRWGERREKKMICKNGHPLEGDNLYISTEGKRKCKECQRTACREWHTRKRRERGIAPRGVGNKKSNGHTV